MGVGHGADPSFLAVSPQVSLVINLVVGCCYLPLGGGPVVTSPAKGIIPLGWYQIMLLGDTGTKV